jgi:ABC-type anion transport system duplicated permease subunit
MTESKNRLTRIPFLLIGICLLALSVTACSGFDSLAQTILAILGSVNVVLATIQTQFPTSIVAAIEIADDIVQGAVNALKTAYDNYVKDKAGTGLLAALQAAVTAVKQTLTQLEAAAHIDNASLQSLILKVVSLIGTVLEEVATAILPNVPAALEAHIVGNDVPAKNLDDQLKGLASKLRADYTAALADSGLDSVSIKAGQDHVNHKLAHHIGPVRV